MFLHTILFPLIACLLVEAFTRKTSEEENGEDKKFEEKYPEVVAILENTTLSKSEKADALRNWLLAEPHNIQWLGNEMKWKKARSELENRVRSLSPAARSAFLRVWRIAHNGSLTEDEAQEAEDEFESQLNPSVLAELRSVWNPMFSFHNSTEL